MPVAVSEKHVGRHPDDEDRHADGNTGQRGTGTEREVGPGEGADQGGHDEDARQVDRKSTRLNSSHLGTSNAVSTPDIYTLSLHDALPISILANGALGRKER